MVTRPLSRIISGLMAMLLFAALHVGALSPATAADFDKGMAANQNVDTGQLLAKWLPLANEGNAVAQFIVGYVFFNGIGVPKDSIVSEKWYRRSAENGFAGAQHNLALMYFDGDGVQQNYNEAIKWFRLAAKQGDVVAQYNLGVIFSNGDGVAQHYVTAHMWLNVAASTGNLSAVQMRNEISAKMSPAAISEAQALAQRCLASNYQECGD